MRKIELEITGPDGRVHEELLSQELAILGSGPAATIRLSDSRVAAAHFLLKTGKDGELTLLDLGSETGTRLGGQLVNLPMALTHGAELQVGGTRIRLLFEGGPTTGEIPRPDEDTTAEMDLVETVRARALPANDARRPASPADAPTETAKQLEVSLHWGDQRLEVQTFAPGRCVRVGPGPGSDFPLEVSVLEKSFDLVSSSGAVVPPPGSQLLLRHGDAETTVSRLVKLGLGDECPVAAGAMTLLLRWVRPARRAPAGLFDAIDFGFARILWVGTLAHALVLTGFQITPTTSEFPPEVPLRTPSEILKYLVRPTAKPPVKFAALPPRPSGEKPRGPPGRFGSRSAHLAQAAPSKPGAPIVDPRHREADRKRVLSTGLLAALGETVSAASDVLGPGGLGTGINQALGGLKPNGGIGTMNGLGGLSPHGTGPGGDGHAIGLGGLGTHGPGPGGGGPDFGFSGAGKEPLHIHQDKRAVGVALDKSVIASVIRRHWNEIKYCYETQLNQNPHLSGKVAVAFTIAGTGAVSEALVSESSMGNSRVEDCIVTDIKRWRFPEPRGGGQVFVTYPWVFKAAGETE